MKKIATKTLERKKQRRNNLIISIILILVISLSVFGIVANSFSSTNSSEFTEYQGYKFYSQGDFWALDMGDFSFVFKYLPSELDNISVEINELNLVTNYGGNPLYFSSENSYSTYEIYQNLNQIVSKTQLACLTEEDCQEDLPIKTCEDNFIILKKSETNKIIQQDNCVFIEGTEEDLAKLTDLFLYKIFGIKE